MLAAVVAVMKATQVVVMVVPVVEERAAERLAVQTEQLIQAAAVAARAAQEILVEVVALVWSLFPYQRLIILVM